jgi:hypothetical protein
MKSQFCYSIKKIQTTIVDHLIKQTIAGHLIKLTLKPSQLTPSFHPLTFPGPSKPGGMLDMDDCVQIFSSNVFNQGFFDQLTIINLHPMN